MNGISCYMVTQASRAWCIPLAIRCFHRQRRQRGIGWPVELVVVSDDPEVEAIVDRCRGDIISFHLAPRGLTLGELYNLAASKCRYDWLSKWDDDDWHADTALERITAHVAFSSRPISVIGQTTLLFYDLDEERPWRYYYTGDKPWVATQYSLIHRKVWDKYPHPRLPDRGGCTLAIWDALADPDVLHHVLLPWMQVVCFQHGQLTGKDEWPPLGDEWQKLPVFSQVGVAASMLGDLELWQVAYNTRHRRHTGQIGQ